MELRNRKVKPEQFDNIEETFFQRRHTDGQWAHEKMFNTTNHQGNANQNHSEIITSHLSE